MSTPESVPCFRADRTCSNTVAAHLPNVDGQALLAARVPDTR